MIKLIPFLFLLLGLPENPTAILWKADTKLSWDDFKGTPDHDSPFVASTHSSIVFSYNVTSDNGKLNLTTETRAYFYPEFSWVKKGAVNDHVLRHEQAHFDITEIHARKLRKAFSEYRVRVTAKYAKELSSIFASINNLRQKMQNRYDQETNHSENIEKEEQWQQYIADELLQYEAWKTEN